MADERGSKGSVSYEMQSYVSGNIPEVRSCDIILGVDSGGKVWILHKLGERE